MPLSDNDRNALLGDDPGPAVRDQTHMSVVQGSYEDPDEFAEDSRLARDAGVGVDIVRHDKPEVKRQAGLNKMDIKSLLGDSPALSKWLEKQDNAKLSYDDIPHLADIERTNKRRPWHDLSIRDFDGLVDSMSIGMAKTYDAAMLGFLSQAQDWDTQMIDKYRREGDDHLADELLRIKGAAIDERQAKINKHMASLGVAEEEIARMTPKDLTLLGEGVRGGFQMGADMAPGLAVSFVTGGRVNPTLTLLTTKAGLESYGSARLEGREHGEALIYGGVDAALELITEKVPTKYAEKLFGDIGTGSVKDTIGKFIVGDLAGEQVATLTQTANAVIHDLDEELANAKSVAEMFDIQAQRQVVTAIATLVGGGGISGVAYASDRYATREVRKNRNLLKKLETRVKSEAADQWLDDQIFMAQSSKTNERAKEAFDDYIEGLDPDTRVFINPDALKDIKNPPAFISDQMDGTGADVSIPLSIFLSEVVKDEAMLEQLRPHIKVQSEFLTQNEMETNYDSDQAKTMIAQAEKYKQARTEAEMIYEQVKDQLVGTRRQGPQTAKFSADLIPAYIVTKQAELASRGIDVSVQKLFDDIGLRIIGPGQAPNLQDASKVLEQDVGLVVAARDKDGKVVTGKKGQMHAHLINAVPLDQRADQFTEFGFADKDGNYYTREEALALVKTKVPTAEGTHDEAGEQLDSSDLDQPDNVPTLSRTQQFGDLALVDRGVDEAGNVVEVKEKAQSLWNHQQKRIKMIENLRQCVNG